MKRGKRQFFRKCCGVLTVLSVLFSFALVGRVVAASLSVVYTTNASELPTGTIAASDTEHLGWVLPAASQNSLNNIVGVTVAESEVVVSHNRGVPEKEHMQSQVKISNSGVAKVLVSNINGSITPGDKITVSPLAGIGMLATESGKVVGAAQAELTEQSLGAKHVTITDNKGKKHDILVALIPAMVDISFYQPPPVNNSILPSFLVSFANTVGGHEVSAGRLVASFVIMLIALGMVIILLSNGVRSSIGAIGRNPLAKKAIQSSLVSILLLAALVLAASSSVSYLILRG